MFVWLFIKGFCHTQGFFHSFGDVAITSERLQILTCAQQSWPLSSDDGSLTCHTFCDTDHPFIMVISEDPWYSHLLLSACQWNCCYLFLRLKSIPTGDCTPISSMRGGHSTTNPRWRSNLAWDITSRELHMSNSIWKIIDRQLKSYRSKDSWASFY